MLCGGSQCCGGRAHGIQIIYLVKCSRWVPQLMCISDIYIYIYIYIWNQSSGSIWFQYIGNTTCGKNIQKPNHKALLARGILKRYWWIIVLRTYPWKVYFVIIKDVFIFHCPVGALKQFFLLSSAQQGSDPVFTFTSTKPLTYSKFTKDHKWLLKQLSLGTGYRSYSFKYYWIIIVPVYW